MSVLLRGLRGIMDRSIDFTTTTSFADVTTAQRSIISHSLNEFVATVKMPPVPEDLVLHLAACRFRARKVTKSRPRSRSCNSNRPRRIHQPVIEPSDDETSCGIPAEQELFGAATKRSIVRKEANLTDEEWQKFFVCTLRSLCRPITESLPESL